ncbi:hypothetical protein B0H16DRAFT_1242952, partial [Mycena metata]
MKVWQQNLDRGMENHQQLLQKMGRDAYQFAMLQEPYIDFNNLTRANSHWRVVYPSPHVSGKGKPKPRAVTLVNTAISTDTWTQLQVPSLDMVAVEVKGSAGRIRMVNIYNDGDHNETL